MKRAGRLPLIVTICLIAVAASGQTLRVVDESPADSPLHFSGVVIYNGNNSQCSITGRNSDSRRIVAWVAELDGLKAPFVEDRFFYDDHISLLAREIGLEDGMYDREIDRSIDTGQLCFYFNFNRHLFMTKPSMRIKVRLVQFQDDSVWGDRAAIKELAFQRRDTINFLRSLQSAPNLNKVLAEPTNFGFTEEANADRIRWDRMMVEAPLHYTSKTREEIVAEIENRLAAAKQHKAWMTALK